MDIDLTRSAEQFHNRHRRDRIWKKLVSVLCCVVVFCTTYALILPAITMEREPVCGLAEHQHGEGCYTQQEVRHLACRGTGVHTHTAACADGSCGYGDFALHTHDGSCYEGGRLVCNLPEVKAHTHADDCYQIPTWEEPGHTHTDACYTDTKGELVCGKTETEGHTHTDACYGQKQVLVCAEPESDGHHHGDGCYDEAGVLICEAEESDGHHHGEACYKTETLLICGKTEAEPHQHVDTCYKQERKLTCTEKEGPIVRQGDPELVCGRQEIEAHQHSAACFDADNQWICGKREILSHTHTDACFETATEPVLTCGLEEHTHSDECYPAEETTAAEETVSGMMNAMYSVMALGKDVTDTDISPLSESILPVTSLSGGDKVIYNKDTGLYETKVSIGFAFAADKQPDAGVTYTYTYPSGVIIPEGELNKSMTLLDSSKRPAGTYQFTKNEDGTYSVMVVFNTEYVNTYCNKGELVTGFVNFEGGFAQSSVQADGSIYIDGGALKIIILSEKIEYPGNETNNYDISTSKQGEWSKSGKTLTYTVYVRTTKGTPNPIHFTDTIMIPEGLGLGSPDVKVYKGTTTYYDGWQQDGTPEEESGRTYQFDTQTGVLTMTLGGLSKLEPVNTGNYQTEYYKVTYTYSITGEDWVGEIKPGNTVKVFATDTTKNQTISAEASSVVTLSKSTEHTLKKDGQEEGARIKWTLTVNENQVNIAGATLTDDLLQAAENLEVSPNCGYERDTETGVITFTGDTNENQYTITYYTTPGEGVTTVSNHAVLDPTPAHPDSGDEKPAEKTVDISLAGLNKWGSYNKDTGKIDWTIEVNGNGKDIAGLTLNDSFFSALTQGNFTIHPESGYQFLTEEDGVITGIQFTGQSNTSSYTIRYSTVPNTPDPSGETQITNTASMNNGVTKPAEVTVPKISLTKSGEYADGQITWHVIINTERRDIAGYELTDTMFAGLDASAIKVSYRWSVDASSSEYNIKTKEDGTLAVTFNAIGDTGVNTNEYMLTYATAAESQWDERNVANSALLKKGEINIPASAEVTVPGIKNVWKKVGTLVPSEDGKTAAVDWTVTVSVPSAGLPAGTVITDDVTKNVQGATNTLQWMTGEQIKNNQFTITWMNAGGSMSETSYLIQSGAVAPGVTLQFRSSDGTVCDYANVDANKTYIGMIMTFADGLMPPEGIEPEKLSFTYSTTVDLEHSGIGTSYFYNMVAVDNKVADDFVTYEKSGVVKTDGSGNAGTSDTTSAGELVWKVKVKTVGSGLTIVTVKDTLPDGVLLKTIQVEGDGTQSVLLTVAANNTISGDGSPYHYSGTYDPLTKAVSLTITNQTAESALLENQEWNLTFVCAADDAVLPPGTMYELTNRVTVESNQGTIGFASQTQKWTHTKTEEETNKVQKTGKWDNNNRLLNYSIVLNPEGSDLVDGVDTLTLTDELTYPSKYIQADWYDGSDSETFTVKADLIQNSVRLFQASWDGGQWVKSTEITAFNWVYSTVKGTDYQETVTSTLTVSGIPDKQPLIFEYSYFASSSAETHKNEEKIQFDLPFRNEAKLTGTDGSDTSFFSNVKWSHSSSSAGVTTSGEHTYTFYKVKKGSFNATLPGAVFSVYEYSKTSGWSTDPIGTYTTNDEGQFEIAFEDVNSAGNKIYKHNTLYRICETTAPSGYIKTDNEFRYFYFSNTEDPNYMPDTIQSGALDLSTSAGSAYVENAPAEITVQKVWKDSGGNTFDKTGGSVTINLYQKTSQGSSSGGSGGDGTPIAVKIGIVDESGNWVYVQDGNGTLGSQSKFVTLSSGTTITIRLYCRYGSSTEGWAEKWKNSSAKKNGEAITRVEADGGNTYSFTCQVTENNTEIEVLKDWGVEATAAVTIDQTTAGNSNTENEEGTSATPEGTCRETITLDASNNWTHTFTDLPLTGKDTEGNTVNYYYYVQEGSVSGYETSYSNNGGIQSGTITVTNTATSNPTYELPDTGGHGTMGYTLGGVTLTAGAALWLLCRRKRRREAL